MSKVLEKDIDIYHLSCIENLESIIQNGMIFSNRMIHLNKILVKDISYTGIQDKREKQEVPLPPYGNLHDYVPFFFCPRPPLLYPIKSKIHESFHGDQSSILHLVTSINKVIAQDSQFVFTDGQAIMKFTQFFNDIDDLSALDWLIIKEKYWGNTSDDGDRIRRKQSEFLIKDSVSVHLIKEIGVMNESISNRVKDLIIKNDLNSEVKVVPEWYY